MSHWRLILPSFRTQRQHLRNPLFVVFLVWGAMFALFAMIFSCPDQATFRFSQAPPLNNKQSRQAEPNSNDAPHRKAKRATETVEIFSVGVDVLSPHSTVEHADVAHQRLQRRRTRVAGPSRPTQQETIE
jgi:hypothetical protein